MALSDIRGVTRITGFLRTIFGGGPLIKAVTLKGDFLCIEFDEDALKSIRFCEQDLSEWDVTIGGMKASSQMLETVRKVMNASILIATSSVGFIKINEAIEAKPVPGGVQVVFHSIKEAFGELENLA